MNGSYPFLYVDLLLLVSVARRHPRPPFLFLLLFFFQFTLEVVCLLSPMNPTPGWAAVEALRGDGGARHSAHARSAGVRVARGLGQDSGPVSFVVR